MHKRLVIFVSIAFSLFFIRCQPDEITISPVVETDEVTVSGEITSDVTWTSGNTYILEDMVAVTNNATLTIEPCVVVKVQNGANGLIISQGAKLNAEGTSVCPIIFTSVDDMLEPGQILSPNLTGDDHGLWSGVFLLGNAPVSSEYASSNVISLLPPLSPFVFGGDDPEDSSGSLAYVSIRHTGYETAPAEKPSGLTICGVGSGTTIDRVELFGNADDGLLLIGGTVNVANLVTSGFRDDGIDCNQGYAGTIDNIIGIGGNENSFSLELDGGEVAANPSFTIRNASFQGSETGEGYIDFQNDVHCLIENAYFFGFDAAGRIKLDEDTDADNWLNELIDVMNVEINTSHLTAGNTTIETIFVDAGSDGNDAFSQRLPDAAIVTTPSTGADKSVFADWTVVSASGALDTF